jgi:hypothetical protein
MFFVMCWAILNEGEPVSYGPFAGSEAAFDWIDATISVNPCWTKIDFFVSLI